MKKILLNCSGASPPILRFRQSLWVYTISINSIIIQTIFRVVSVIAPSNYNQTKYYEKNKY